MSEDNEISTGDISMPVQDSVKPENQFAQVTGLSTEPTPQVQNSYQDFLAKAQTNELSPEDTTKFLTAVASDPELGLSDENKEALLFLGTEAQAGRIKPEDVVAHMGGVVSKAQLPPAERKEAESALTEIQTQLAQAGKGGRFDEAFVQKKANRLVQIIKIVGMVILAVLGIGAFKALKFQIGGEQQ